MKEYTVLKPLTHDDRGYLPGDPIELDATIAAYLLGRHDIADPKAQQPETANPKGK